MNLLNGFPVFVMTASISVMILLNIFFSLYHAYLRKHKECRQRLLNVLYFVLAISLQVTVKYWQSQHWYNLFLRLGPLSMLSTFIVGLWTPPLRHQWQDMSSHMSEFSSQIFACSVQFWLVRIIQLKLKKLNLIRILLA